MGFSSETATVLLRKLLSSELCITAGKIRHRSAENISGLAVTLILQKMRHSMGLISGSINTNGPDDDILGD